MTSAHLFRLSGLALLIALPLQLLGFILHPPSEDVTDVLKPLYSTAHLLLFVSWLFALFGLIGFYLRQAQRSGVVGLVGFVVTLFAAAYHFYLLLYEAYATVKLASNPDTQALVGDGPLAHGAGALGPFGAASVLAFPLLGIATVRAGVLPSPAGWLQIASIPVFILSIFIIKPDGPIPVPGITPIALLYYLAFLGYAWGGYALWTGDASSREPASRHETAPTVATASPGK